jgi:hypothetical protein
VSALRLWRERCHLALETRGPWFALMPQWWLTGVSQALAVSRSAKDENEALQLVSDRLRDECLGSYQHNRRGLADARRWLREEMDAALTPTREADGK